MSRVFVGVDGGGTHARAVVVDDNGRELARFTGPAGIVNPRDPRAAAGVVRDVALAAMQAAGVQPPAAALCCGLAGAGRTEQSMAVHDGLVQSGVAEKVMVVGDAEAAMADAFADGPGVLLIAGTGSIAWARNAAGDVVRVGGWGQLLGDEGSGYAIGLSALRAIARASDGRTGPTALSEIIVRACGVSTPSDLIAWAAAADKGAIGALAPLVMACDDDIASGIIDRAVGHLLHHVDTAGQTARIDQPVIALSGGIIAPGGPLHDRLVAALHRTQPYSTILDRNIDPAWGAARMALEVVRGRHEHD